MLKLINLDDQTRRFMLDELTYDLQHGALYVSARLTAAGARNYPRILQEAIAEHDDLWLESELRAHEYMRTTEVHHNGRGTSVVTVPASAAQSLAEEEFNRYYMRGVCRRAIVGDISDVAVYRAKESGSLTPTIEQKLCPSALLAGLRQHHELGTLLGTSAASLCLSVYLPKVTA